MSVTLEQIEMLKQRADISYGEAKQLLEQSNGDVLEALINLEKQAKLKAPKTECCEPGFVKKVFKTCERLIKKGNEIKFIISKAEKPVLDVPLNLIILVTLITPPITIAGIILALITNHRVRFVKPNGEDMEINKAFDKVSSAVSSVSNHVAEEINK